MYGLYISYPNLNICSGVTSASRFILLSNLLVPIGQFNITISVISFVVCLVVVAEWSD